MSTTEQVQIEKNLLSKLARLSVRRRLLLRRSIDHDNPHFKRCRVSLDNEEQDTRMRLAEVQGMRQFQIGQQFIRAEQPQPYRFSQRWDFGQRTTKCPNCKAIMWMAERVQSSSKNNPRFSLCCQNGQTVLPILPPPPPYLDSLLQDHHFKDKIRLYNSMLSFTSMGGKIDNSVNEGRGPYVFRISGSNYHKIGSLLPKPGQGPKFAQLYIYDTNNEVHNRINAIRASDSSEIKPEILQGLQAMLDVVNPYVTVFRKARDMIRDHEDIPQLYIKIIKAREGRQYLQPTGNEVAALLVGDETENLGARDVIVKKLDGQLQRIDETHPAYMPLQYPLLFPYGTDGWRVGIPKAVTSSTSQDTVSMRQFHAFRLQDREEEGTNLIQGARLYQQYIVDAYAAIEQNRLFYIRCNQGKLRADLYCGIQDAIDVEDVNANAVGRRYILPSTFYGSRRNMMRHYQDAIAICTKLGPPDFFVTFTCNPKWPEIVADLARIPGQRPEDRPDIVCRVFKIKLKELLQDFKQKHFFGKTIADLHVIEFQKRGLPHAHILLTLAAEDKPTCAEDIDKLISAEIPHKESDPLAYETVTKFMVHGPCGPCLVDGRCSKNYPKMFHSETTIDENGFVQYRRRQSETPHILNGREVDNRWVVPYNRDLCVKYDAHINVERVAVRSVVKYLYKYIHKGHDRATITIQDSASRDNFDGRQPNRIDEIQQYLDCRYVSAMEACWRIFDFELQHHYPSVERLQYHLPGEQMVVFNADDDIHEVVNRPNLKATMLTMWFEANKEDTAANEYTYVDFPSFYVWNRTLKRWTRRILLRGSIGRLPYAHPNCGERYYLRMLLTKVKGAKCYEDLRTVRKVLHPTFKAACLALGLLDDDNEWHAALSEAATWASGAQLRNMFCSILMFAETSDPKQLWERHWVNLTDDLQHMVRLQTGNPDLVIGLDELQNLGLIEIEHVLNKNGRSLKDYPPMPLPSTPTEHRPMNRLIRDELDYDTNVEAARFDALVKGLNSDQFAIYASIVNALSNDKGGLFFVYGSGGTGKTYLWNTLVSKLRSERKIVISVASSGIAALLLPGGKTAHSVFKIPLHPDETSVCSFDKLSDRAQLIRETSLIIWDEAPMTNRLAFEAVDRHLKDICDDDRAFGGKLVVLGGDFRQILPVVPNGGRELIVAATLHKASFWEQCEVLHLRINMRLLTSDTSSENFQRMKHFAEWILQVGEGKVVGTSISEESEANWIEIPKDYLVEDNALALRNLINEVYPDLASRYIDWSYLKERGILAPTNNDVDELNSIMLSMLPGEQRTYLSSDTFEHSVEDGNIESMQPVELLHSMNISGLPNHCLDLKVGAPVILLRNMDQSIGLCNGSRLVVHKMGDKVIEAKVITGPKAGDSVLIPRIDLSPSKQLSFPMKRRQFPLKLAFAMTINKSQGQTMNMVMDIKFIPIRAVTLSTLTTNMRLRLLHYPSERITLRGSKEQRSIHLIFIDSEGDDIEVLIQNHDIDRFKEILKQGRVYAIKKLELMPLGTSDLHTSCSHRLKFGRNTEVSEILDEDACSAIPSHIFKFQNFSDIPLCNNGTAILVDVIGLVIYASSCSTTIRNTKKRDILLLDQNLKTVRLTLWGDLATSPGEILFDTIEKSNIVVASKVVVRDICGVCLSTYSWSRIIIDPDIAETYDLLNWYAENMEVQKIVRWTQQRDIGIVEMDHLSNAKRISLIEYSPMSKVKYFRVCAYVVDIDTNGPLWYDACSYCKKKVEHNMCLKHGSINETVPRYRVGMTIADSTCEKHITLFDELAERIIGKSATEVKNYYNEDMQHGTSLLIDYLKKCRLQSWIFVIEVPIITGADLIVDNIFPVKWEEECYYLRKSVV